MCHIFPVINHKFHVVCFECISSYVFRCMRFYVIFFSSFVGFRYSFVFSFSFRYDLVFSPCPSIENWAKNRISDKNTDVLIFSMVRFIYGIFFIRSIFDRKRNLKKGKKGIVNCSQEIRNTSI